MSALTVWSVTYIDDDYADVFGTRLFRTEAEAEAFAAEYESAQEPVEEGCEGQHLFTLIEKHELT